MCLLYVSYHIDIRMVSMVCNTAEKSSVLNAVRAYSPVSVLTKILQHYELYYNTPVLSEMSSGGMVRSFIACKTIVG